VKTALEGDDDSAVESAVEKLQGSMGKIGEAVYLLRMSAASRRFLSDSALASASLTMRSMSSCDSEVQQEPGHVRADRHRAGPARRAADRGHLRHRRQRHRARVRTWIETEGWLSSAVV
jgi:hypothetical protein